MGFSRQGVEELSAALGEPSWVLERRIEAWDYFEKLELPVPSEDESWRYTDLGRMKFNLDSFTPAPRDPSLTMTGAQIDFMRDEGARGGYVVQRDSDVVHRELSPELAEKGVIFTDINTAISKHESLIQPHLFAEVLPSEGILAALHAAFFCGGTFLYVPRGVTVELPLEAQRWIDEGGAAIFPHTLIVVEEGAEVTYLERFESTPLDSPALSSAAVEIVAAPNSRVSFFGLQEYGDGVWHFQTHRAISQRNVELRSLIVSLGGKLSRQVVETLIRGDHSSSEMLGLYFAHQGQHFDFRTRQDHQAPDSFSDLLYKGALRDDSRAVYAGVIRVAPGAARTDAYQTNRNLVLSDHAKADSKPELEIENNDVKCSHAASVGQINEEEVFYFLSRGIPRPEAERLIVKGFFEEVITRIRNVEIREVLTEAIERKLSGAPS